jgi:hypothetical protein
MPNWPTSLPKPGPGNYSEQAQSGLLVSDMEMGPPKVRRRFTATGVQIEMRLVLTTAQLSDLESFHKTDCLNGALPFDWNHPRTGAAVKARFIAPPAYTSAGRGYWPTAISLMVLP